MHHAIVLEVVRELAKNYQSPKVKSPWIDAVVEFVQLHMRRFGTPPTQVSLSRLRFVQWVRKAGPYMQIFLLPPPRRSYWEEGAVPSADFQAQVVMLRVFQNTPGETGVSVQ
jgi:hypothetical protein